MTTKVKKRTYKRFDVTQYQEYQDYLEGEKAILKRYSDACKAAEDEFKLIKQQPDVMEALKKMREAQIKWIGKKAAAYKEGGEELDALRKKVPYMIVPLLPNPSFEIYD